MDAGEFHGRVASALRGLMAERRVRQIDVADLKGSTAGAVTAQLGNRASMPLSDLEIYARALSMTPEDLMVELARRIIALRSATGAGDAPTGGTPSQVTGTILDDLAMAS